MNSIYTTTALNEFTQRIDTLKKDAQQQWGKMNVAQMLAHCSVALEDAVSDNPGKRLLMGRIFGGFAKKSVTNEEPFKKGLPTAPTFVITDTRDFEKEKERLKTALQKVCTSGETKLADKLHPFFGKMNKEEWSNLMYKHLDHHLRQFGA